MALAHIDGLPTRVKNEIVVAAFKRGEPLSAFFGKNAADWVAEYELAEEAVAFVEAAKASLGNYSFLAEDLLSQGYQMIPITDPAYPASLKRNLKYNSPLLLYVKGNPELLNSPCTAIVGSRKAGARSLEFTANVARKYVSEGRTVVSGYAAGVDRRAYDETVRAGGNSIIILPQGITTFGAGYRAEHKYISRGKVAVVSPFAPAAPWTVGLAMARNPIIYGFADTIYAAESDSKGGTFSGVVDGLRRRREIYVRVPEAGEDCANDLLIELGAVGVDIDGEKIAGGINFLEILKEYLKAAPRSVKEISSHLYNADDKTAQGKARRLLNQIDDVQKSEGSPVRYFLSSTPTQASLFDL